MWLFFAITLALFSAYKWITKQYQFFEGTGISYLKPVPIIGNMWRILRSRGGSTAYNKIIYNLCPNEKMFGFFQFLMPKIVVRDPELIKRFLITDFNYFEDHRRFTEDNPDRLFTKTILLLRGKRWRDMRSQLSPLYTSTGMRYMFELISECCQATIDSLSRETKTDKVNLEMKDFFFRFTNDVFASCALGMNLNSFEEKDNSLLRSAKDATEDFFSTWNMFKAVIIKALPSKLSRWLKLDVTCKETNEFFRTLLFKNIASRKRKNMHRPDLVNTLMEIMDKKHDETSANGESKSQFSENEIVAQMLILYAGNFETISGALSFLAHELGVNPEVQQKLYAEVRALEASLNGKPVTYDAIQGLKYMDQVIREALRKWSTAALDRICVKDYTFQDDDGKQITIKKGTLLWFPVFGLHYDPKYYPEPDRFNPDRFSEENKKNIPSGAYLAFGDGPRACIGTRFSLMDMKLITYYLLSKFTLEPNEKTDQPLQMSNHVFRIMPKNGFHLSIRQRSNSVVCAAA